jgi:hypothetical protein
VGLNCIFPKSFSILFCSVFTLFYRTDDEDKSDESWAEKGKYNL